MTAYAFNSDLREPKTERLATSTLRELGARTMLPWLADAAIDWLVIGAALATVQFWPNPVTLFAAILVVGNRQHALAILGHDGTHYTLSRRGWLNDLLTNLFCFWPLGLTVSGYRALHYTHHKHTGTENDPELGHKRLRAPQWDLPGRLPTVLRYALADLVGYSLADYVIVVRFAKPERRVEYLPFALYHLASLSLLLVLGLWPVALVWYLCLVTSFMMFFRLRLWLEHQGTGDTQRLVLTPIQGMLIAPHNAWHHWEHHQYPTIPYHRLPEARRLLAGPAALPLQDLIRSLASTQAIPSGAALKRGARTVAAQEGVPSRVA